MDDRHEDDLHLLLWKKERIITCGITQDISISPCSHTMYLIYIHVSNVNKLDVLMSYPHKVHVL